MPWKPRNFVLAFLCALTFSSLGGQDVDDRGGFVFYSRSGFLQAAACNGVLVSKVPKLSPKCEYGILTATHCISEIAKIYIDSDPYEIVSTSTLRDNDAALTFIEARCDRFEDERVYPIKTEIVPERAELTIRKSMFWTKQLASLGYGADTPNIGGKQIRGITVSSYDGQTKRGYKYFLAAGKDTIEKGDSGSPVFWNGSIVGVVSGGRPGTEAPFNIFLYAGQEAMDWTVKELLDRYRHLPIRTRR